MVRELKKPVKGLEGMERLEKDCDETVDAVHRQREQDFKKELDTGFYFPWCLTPKRNGTPGWESVILNWWKTFYQNRRLQNLGCSRRWRLIYSRGGRYERNYQPGKKRRQRRGRPSLGRAGSGEGRSPIPAGAPGPLQGPAHNHGLRV
jgi:hypothetical protein